MDALDLRIRRGMLASLSGGLATMGSAVPYALAAGSWDTRRTEIAEAALAEVARFAPDVLDCLVEWEVLGPAECVRAKVKDRYRRHIGVKAPPEAELGPLLDASARALPACRGVTLAIDVDAYDML